VKCAETLRDSGGWHSRLSTERDSTRIDLGATYTPGKPLHCLFLSSATILPSAELSPCALHAGKSGNQIERCIISTFQIAESMGGFKGDFRQWDGCEPLWTLSQEIGVAGDLVSYQAKSRMISAVEALKEAHTPGNRAIKFFAWLRKIDVIELACKFLAMPLQ